ncbi:MAG: hypothetical protein BWY74_03214 [Firmicutes bacterium ADurb.Bin419]|nr:MAG: hypothetical protein BWY74_03214 [Firmicutes bacterium ADurb.Bin419]
MDMIEVQFRDILFLVILPTLCYLNSRSSKIEGSINEFKVSVAKEYASKEYLEKIEGKIDDLRKHNENFALKSDIDKLECKIDDIKNILMKAKG